MPRPWLPDTGRSYRCQDHISCSKGPNEWIFHGLVHIGYFRGLWIPSCSARPPIYFPWDLMYWDTGCFLLTSPFLWSIWDHLVWPPTTDLTRHTSLVLLKHPGVLQQSQLCKTRCGSPSLKTKLLFRYSGFMCHSICSSCGFRRLVHCFLWTWCKSTVSCVAFRI